MSAILHSFDFANFQLVLEATDYPLDKFPEFLRPTVERMRWVKQVNVTCIAQVGEGSFGKVYRGQYRNKDEQIVTCAVKVFHPDISYECYAEASNLWKCTGVPHAVRLHGIKRFIPDKYAVVMDWIEGPNLEEYRDSLGPRTLDETIALARQLLTFLHGMRQLAPNRTQPVVHCDLAPPNLFWVNRVLTVVDFCSSRYEDKVPALPVQRIIYRAPEIFLNPSKFSTSIDMWSLAVIVHDFVAKFWFAFITKEDFSEEFVLSQLVHRLGMPRAEYLKNLSDTKYYFKIKDGRYVLNDRLARFHQRRPFEAHHEKPNSSPELIDFLRKAFAWDPAERLTPAQALAHPLFKPSEGA